MFNRHATTPLRLCGALLVALAVLASFGAHAAAAPAAEPTGPRRIEVSLSQQQLYAWQGKMLLFQFPVTTGQEGQETVTGQYQILDKELDTYSEGWQLDLPFWMGIYQFSDYEDGFHALPSDDAGNVYWEDALGKYPASHGCIVLSAADAQALFNWADVGTAVDIHN